jgi:hypothetical protein
MAATPDGHQPGSPARRFRFDDLESTVLPSTASAIDGGVHHSGRKAVIGLCLGVLLLWGGLYLVFRDWRERYNARAQFGATQVAPVIDGMANPVPPGVDPDEWRRAVAETHEMLVTLTGSNLLDRQGLQALRDELGQVVARARAHPETARDELAGVWNRTADRAGFVLSVTDRRDQGRLLHPRPGILPPRPDGSRTRDGKGTPPAGP